MKENKIHREHKGTACKGEGTRINSYFQNTYSFRAVCYFHLTTEIKPTLMIMVCYHNYTILAQLILISLISKNIRVFSTCVHISINISYLIAMYTHTHVH
ncbi:hypothetical protein BD560DRAFT_395016 [Blakeslea trispora]|nr:hypothetical protein BD560DRAFT_395016 [Blakeslea trispora]